jgi:HlyD family secretion protein
VVVLRACRCDRHAQGTLAPESEVRRFYAPVDGELADLYVAEGQPVSKDDVLARLNARGAIEAAANALEAQLKLEDPSANGSSSRSARR